MKRVNAQTVRGPRSKSPNAVASVPTPAKPELVPDLIKVAPRPKRTPRPAPPAPEPPNPHVLELQGQIIKLVNMREALQAREAEATDTAAVAQAQLQSARSSLQRVESEVNYRIDLIAKLTGKPLVITNSTNQSRYIAPPFDNLPGNIYDATTVSNPTPFSPGGFAGVGSIPPARPMQGGGPEGNVRMESAEDVRRSL